MFLLFSVVCILATSVIGNTITCDDTTPCNETTIDCTAGEACTVNCMGGDPGVCNYATIDCPANFDCNVICAFNAGAYGTDNTKPGDGWTTANCKGVTINGGDNGELTIDAYGRFGAIRESQINCPKNAECIVNCGVTDEVDSEDRPYQNGAYKHLCKQSTFDARESTKLTMNGYGQEVFKEARVYCPYADGKDDCRVHAEWALKRKGGAGKNMFHGFQIYTKDGKKDAEVTCDWGEGTTNESPIGLEVCYPVTDDDDEIANELYGPRLFCNDGGGSCGSTDDYSYATSCALQYDFTGTGVDKPLHCPGGNVCQGNAATMNTAALSDGSSVSSPIIGILCVLLVIALATAVFFYLKSKKIKAQMGIENNIVIDLNKGKEAEIKYENDEETNDNNDGVISDTV